MAIHYHENESAARETLEQCRAALAKRQGAQAEPAIFRADMAKPEEVRSLVDQVEEQFGAVHILVNNAGIYRDNPFDEPDWNRWIVEWRTMIDVNLMGPAHAIWCVLPQMKQRGEGRIINIVSRAAFRGEISGPDYGATKAALVNLTRSLARAMGPHGIVASCVAPGWVETEMASQTLDSDPRVREMATHEVPLGRIATPEDVAGAILYLASPLGAYLNGVCIPVNGGSFLHS